MSLLPCSAASARAQRVYSSALLALMAALLACGCAVRGPRPTAAQREQALDELHTQQLLGVWQQKLAAHIEQAGHGDPAVLARLPALRATGTLRPARISFGVLDVEARVSEDDGFDVQGLLLAPEAAGAADAYVFVVGIVQRQGYRPVAIADIRLVAMTVHGSQFDWRVGDHNPQALARYRAALDPAVPLRFPADKDEFELVPCAPRLCVDEASTRARWSLPGGI